MIALTVAQAEAVLSILGPFEAEPCGEPGDHDEHSECSGYDPIEVEAIYRAETAIRDQLNEHLQGAGL